MDFVRKMVSKKKRRFEWGTFDLDLTYITDRVIAMGYPSESIEGLYRNNMKDVQRFFNTLHADHYKVINLCSERRYTHDKFMDNVSEYPFDDHNPPNLDVIALFCQDIEEWLDKHPENVVAVHCKAGKGRTGTMIACWLMYSKACQTGSEAIRMFGNKRTHNGKGITIPSQARYVRYFEALLQYGLPIQQAPNNITKILSSIRLNPLPNFNIGGGCEPFLSIGQKDKSVYYTKPMKLKKGTHIVEIDCGNIILTGDVKVQFYNRNSKGHMFSFCFHTAFVDGNNMHIRRLEIDKAHKDVAHKHFHQNFTIELVFCEELDDDDEMIYDDLMDQKHQESDSISTISNSSNSSNTTNIHQPFGTTFSTGLVKLYNNNGSDSKKSTLKFDNNNNSPKIIKDQSRKVSASQQVLTCPKCMILIMPGEPSINDGKSNYHWKCLTCNTCQKSLDTESHCLFQQSGDMLCLDCGSKKNGFFNICSSCNLVITTSDFEEVGELLFHKSCFLCHLCTMYLGGEVCQFIIKPDKRLECSICIEKEKHFHPPPLSTMVQEEDEEEKVEEEIFIPIQPDSDLVISKVAPSKRDEVRRTSIIKCQKCQLGVGLRPLILDIGIWHKECFSCHQCNNIIDTSIYYIKNEQPLCSDCDAKDRALLEEFYCYSCKLQIVDDEMMEAMGEKWHLECLVCVVCKCQIDGPFGDNNGFIYCKKHYEEMFGTKCDECQNIIVGTFLKVNDKQLHPQCFKCFNCSSILEGGSYYSKGSDIICELCRQSDLQKRRTQIQLQNKMIGIRNSICMDPSTSPNSSTTPNILTSSSFEAEATCVVQLSTSPQRHAAMSISSPSSPSQSPPAKSSSILFQKRCDDPTRHSVRVNVSDLKLQRTWEDQQNRQLPDKRPTLNAYPSFHRKMMEKKIDDNTINNFKAAKPTKGSGTLRRNFLSNQHSLDSQTI